MELSAVHKRSTSASRGDPIRLVIQQPSLAKYRIGVFRELAQRAGIDLKVVYGLRHGVPNVAAEGFVAEPATLRQWSVLRQAVFWHRAQWDCAVRCAADVLMLTWNTRYASLVPALLRARRQGVATILWGHGYSKQERSWRAGARIRIAQLATALLFYNRTAAEAYLAAGWDPQRIFVAINSLDQAPIEAARESWHARPAKLDQFRRDKNLVGRRVILYVSRHHPANRLDLLVAAVAQLVARYPTICVVAIGNGDAEIARLKDLAERLAVADRIRFVGALYDEMQLAPWFLCADLFCYPANIGLSLLHAFGYGLPVITSDRTESQNPEIEALRNGANGLLYADGQRDALVEALDQILADPQRARRMSAVALETVREEFTLPRMVDGMEAAARYCQSVACSGRRRDDTLR
jgi:glycosyltransferase involved in cell wall biosynthesis